MIINFTVGNYRSFRDKEVLNMEATAIRELNESVIEKEGYRLLPSAVIYGANPSGKSNLLKAIGRFEKIISSPSRLNSTDRLKISPFLLNQEIAKEPSFSEIKLLLDNIAYRCGFTTNSQKVHEEWLYAKEGKVKKERCLFARTEERIGITDSYSEGKGLEEKVCGNGLFLSTADPFSSEITKKIIYKIGNFWITSDINRESWFGFTDDMCNIEDLDLSFQQETQDFLKSMNVGLNRSELPEGEKLAKEIKVYTIHNLYNEQGEVIGETHFFMKEYESLGTNKLFDLVALVISQLTLGDLLIIDELNSKLRPLLIQHTIKLFNNPKTNPKGAQLVSAIHGTNSLNVKTFRRDRTWFTEKDHSGVTDLYLLAGFRGPKGNKTRKDRSSEEGYINGRYSAISYTKDQCTMSRLLSKHWFEKIKRKQKQVKLDKRRKVAVRNVSVSFLIVCEGERTEPNYSKTLIRDHYSDIREVTIEGKGQGTVSLIKETVAIRDESNKEFDRVWAVFDKDNFNDFNNVIQLVKKNHILCTWSSESFEL